MLQIVIPMAGKGQRFLDAGFTDPKPFIKIGNKPMIQRVVENLIPYEPHRFIFLARREHEKYIKQHMSFATDIIYVDEVTEGAACTVLLAKELIDNHLDPLIIANGDQMCKWNDNNQIVNDEEDCVYWKESNNIQDMINYFVTNNYDAGIATFNDNHPRWSYVKVGLGGDVCEVAEKKVISNDATVGVYYFSAGSLFVRNAEEMIRLNKRVNNEFYVCPVFNEFVEQLSVGIYPVDQMFGLGTPEDLEKNKRYII